MLKKYFTIKKIYLVMTIVLIFSGFLAVSYCQAQDTQTNQSVVDGIKGKCLDSGDCELNDFTRIAIQVAQIILALSGSAALLAFIAGGVMFLASAGNKTWIDRGKAAITGAVIGLVIVFASWIIIGFVITKLVPEGSSQWYKGGWFTGQN